MQKKVFLVLLLPLLIIPSIAFGINPVDSEIRMAEQQQKIDFLEKQLAQKTIEYEWLLEIVQTTMPPTLDP